MRKGGSREEEEGKEGKEGRFMDLLRRMKAVEMTMVAVLVMVVMMAPVVVRDDGGGGEEGKHGGGVDGAVGDGIDGIAIILVVVVVLTGVGGLYSSGWGSNGNVKGRRDVGVL